MSKILVTGANGFVGRHLTKALLDKGHEVIAVTSSMGNIAFETTWNNFPATETVIHLAAKTFVPDSWKQPEAFMETNAFGTLRALEYCRKHQANMVFISSYLYGNPTSLPIHETAPIFTPNPYALSKKTAEDFCKFYAEAYGVNAVVIRPFNIYGVGQSSSFLLPMLINQVLTKAEVSVMDLEPKRDYVYIDDLVNAIIQSLSLNEFEIINIGSGTSFSVGELIAMIQSICKTNHPVYSSDDKRKAEIMNTLADISKAAKFLNWQPLISMEDGLKKIIDEQRKTL